MSRVGHEERHFVYNSNSYPGDSGGAILLKKGKVMGMHVVRVHFVFLMEASYAHVKLFFDQFVLENGLGWFEYAARDASRGERARLGGVQWRTGRQEEKNDGGGRCGVRANRYRLHHVRGSGCGGTSHHRRYHRGMYTVILYYKVPHTRLINYCENFFSIPLRYSIYKIGLRARVFN